VVVVCFIDIGGIVDHHCLNFPLTTNALPLSSKQKSDDKTKKNNTNLNQIFTGQGQSIKITSPTRFLLVRGNLLRLQAQPDFYWSGAIYCIG
jgi:hypothetical protein